MKTIKLFLISVLFLLTTTLFGQQTTNAWGKWNWLVGEWVGEGQGQPGQGEGKFSFQLDLDKNILVRKSYSAYPAKNDKPALMHEDLMIIYRGETDVPSKAIYFDNENHVINYSVSMNDKSIVFLSEKIQNVPIFRLTYTLIEPEKVNIKFEMSRDGLNFMTYIEGKSIKTKLQ